VRCVFTGTQTLTPALYRKAESMFGPVVRITYGKSECTNPITVLGMDDTRDLFSDSSVKTGACVGWPASGVELSIRSDDGAILLAGTAGEIWLRAGHMYIGQIGPDGFQPLADDAWHNTGDFGHLDQRGRLWLEGRVADVIKSGGYKVTPDEIEAVLSGLPGCGEICIATLPSEYWGEVIVAVAEKAGDLWQAAAEHRVSSLSRHKRPRLWIALDALPRNAQGKVSRREVRGAIQSRYALVDGPHPRLTPIAQR
jgi:acyl-CoA synthetase (AMP-forming)/AMP-acid ligase II